MTVHFTYSGRIKEAALLPALVEEIEDICNSLEWEYETIEPKFPDDQFITPENGEVYGIIFTPEGSKPTSFTFNSEGKIYNPFLKSLMDERAADGVKVLTLRVDLDKNEIKAIEDDDPEMINPTEMLYSVSIEVDLIDEQDYIRQLELIRYLSNKYFDDFELYDETNYWETGQIDIPYDKIEEAGRIIESFKELLNNAEINSPSDFLKILQQFKQQFDKDKEEEL